jgi:hypothetical protein
MFFDMTKDERVLSCSGGGQGQISAEHPNESYEDDLRFLDPFQSLDFLSPFMDLSDGPQYGLDLAVLQGENPSFLPHISPFVSDSALREQHPLERGIFDTIQGITVTQVTKHAENTTASGRDALGRIDWSLPQITPSISAPHPAPTISNETRRALVADLALRTPGASSHGLELPSAPVLEKFLDSFTSSFNRHVPIFHIPTLQPETTPSPLVLAMCAIGALLLLDRPNASLLYTLARRALAYEYLESRHEHPTMFWDWSRPSETEVPVGLRPLWDTQTNLLLTYFGAFCGHPDLVVRTMEEIGSLSCVCRIRSRSPHYLPSAGISPQTSRAMSLVWDSETNNLA